MKIVHGDPPLNPSKNGLFGPLLTWKNFRGQEEKFRWSEAGRTQGLHHQILQVWHPYPQSKGREREIPPLEFWIRGDVPVCIAKDGGEKLTRRGIIGCGKKKTMSEGSPTIEHFWPTNVKFAQGYIGMGDTKKDLSTRECFMSSIPHGFSGDVNQFGEMACSATTHSGEGPIHPWSEGSGENINSTPAPIPKEKIQMWGPFYG